MKSLTKNEGNFGVLSWGLYEQYKKKFRGIDIYSEANVKWDKWLRICRKFNEAKLTQVINDGILFKMPYRLGIIGIIQFKYPIKFDNHGNLITKKLRRDWFKTRELWKRLYSHLSKEEAKKIPNKPTVYFTNEHTDGRVFKFYWKKRNCNIKNRSAYEFVVLPRYKKLLAKVIFSNPCKQYCEKY